jgi:hypothetical protein
MMVIDYFINIKMFDPRDVPKIVNSVNGKSNAVSIESGDSSITVDNSELGKIKLKVGGSGSDVVKWENGNTINNPSIQLIGGDPTTGDAIHIMSTNDTRIDAENQVEIVAGHGPLKLTTYGDMFINSVRIDIDDNGISFTDVGKPTGSGTVRLNWGFIGNP